MLRSFMLMPLSGRVFDFLVLVATVTNLFMAFTTEMKPHWRFHFGYTGTCGLLLSIYIGLRLANVLDVSDYRQLISWLYPCLALCLLMPPVLVHWEKKYYKQALKAEVAKAWDPKP